jgi:hypothetical protein
MILRFVSIQAQDMMIYRGKEDRRKGKEGLDG